MRHFSGGVTVELFGGDTLRLILRSPTGEQVYHDLTPAEAEALREMPAIPEPAPPAAPEPAPAPVEAAPAAATPTSRRKKSGKET